MQKAGVASCCITYTFPPHPASFRASYDLLYLSLNIGSQYNPKTLKTMEKQDVTDSRPVKECKESGKTVKMRRGEDNLCSSTLDIGI